MGGLVATLAVTPVQAGIGFGIGFLIPTTVYVAAVLLLLLGAVLRMYAYVPPEGSPLNRIFRVLRAALFTNRRAPLPNASTPLYSARRPGGALAGRRPLDHPPVSSPPASRLPGPCPRHLMPWCHRPPHAPQTRRRAPRTLWIL